MELSVATTSKTGEKDTLRHAIIRSRTMVTFTVSLLSCSERDVGYSCAPSLDTLRCYKAHCFNFSLIALYARRPPQGIQTLPRPLSQCQMHCMTCFSAVDLHTAVICPEIQGHTARYSPHALIFWMACNMRPAAEADIRALCCPCSITGQAGLQSRRNSRAVAATSKHREAELMWRWPS